MDEIFTCTKKFKQEVFSSVQKELDQFGLFIYNATVKQLWTCRGMSTSPTSARRHNKRQRAGPRWVS